MIALLALIGCGGVEDTWTPPADPPPVVAGAPMVGAAEGFLHLPAGTPLAGFTSRCLCLLGIGSPDGRDSAYTDGFIESAGVHTHPGIKVIWIENGDDHLVLTKTDQIYSNDKLVRAIEDELTVATGIDVHGKVVHTGNHSHHSYGDFSDALQFYLGSDQYNEEIFQREVQQVVAVGKQAFDNLQPAKVGMSITQDWDPNDRIARDRRGVNNGAVIGDPPLGTGKDPNLVLMRFDTLQDEPIAVMVNFGMHGIVLAAETNTLVSSDSGGGVEAYFTEAFDREVVVMFTQGAGGDQSPAGEQEDYAKIESIGERAAAVLMDAWAATPTSDAAFTLQSASRAIPTHPRQMHVTRGGTTDLHYQVYEGTPADDEVFGPDGALLSPIDEWTTDHGALFCGTGDLQFLPGASLPGVEAPPYSQCTRLEALLPLINNYFSIDSTLWGLEADDEVGVPLPLPDSLRANTLATVADGLTVRDAAGEVAISEVLFGFFPGEATSMYTETWRRRAAAELGVDQAVMVSYAMDHEGYLLIPEDWLLGGYEPDITMWGPLQAEYIMEQVLNYSGELLQDDVHQDPDPLGQYQMTSYPVRSLPTIAPDVTPAAGTRVTSIPGYFYLPPGFEMDLEIPATIPRVQGSVQLAWQGGDPGVDDPIVTLERQVGGNWEPVTTPNGRTITDSRHDILKVWTPTPLAPAEALQEHTWWAVWQAVDHTRDRTGLPLGTYRLKVDGQTYGGTATTWPWDSSPYSLTSDPFEVVPATLDVSVVGEGLSVSLRSPADGFRYIQAGGQVQGNNPVPGEITLEWSGPTQTTEVVTGTPQGNRTVLTVVPPADATGVTVTDAFGNTGTIALL